MKEILIYVVATSVFIFFSFLAIMMTKRATSETELDSIVNGTPNMSKDGTKRNLKEKVSESSIYQKKYDTLESLIKTAYERDETPESIIKYEFMMTLIGVGLTLLVAIVSNFLFTIGMAGLAVYFVMMKEISLKSRIKEKNSKFDEVLPQFESNMLLGIQSGASVVKAMEMAIKTLPQGLVQVEFKKLLLETKTYTEDIAAPYLNLSKRVPTKDCQRFCNIVISGIKNGNSMSSILANESEYMTKESLNKIKEKGEKNAVRATAISTGFVFLPLLVLFLAPLMASSM